MSLAIDFGTSRTKIGIVKAGLFVNLVDEAASIPSMIAYNPGSENLYFGFDAASLQEDHIIKIPYLKLALKRNPSFTLGPYNLEQILASFFHYINVKYIRPKNISTSKIITGIPNYFGLRARGMLIRALQQAFTITDIELLPEPIAALMGYNFSHPRSKLSGDILSIDLGGGTSDFSFFTVDEDENEIILESQMQAGHDAFSGSEMDRFILRNVLFPAYAMETGQEIPLPLITEKNLQGKDSYYLYRMLETAEKVKLELDKRRECYIHAVDFFASVSLRMVISVETLIQSLKPVFRRLDDYITQQLTPRAQKLGLYNHQGWQLDYVLLLGGAALTPGLKERVEQLFPEVPVITPAEPELNVVMGLGAKAGEDRIYSLTSIKTIYPFVFFLELFNPEQEACLLHKLTFDTHNLELDLSSRYKIFTLTLDQYPSLFLEQDLVRLRLWEAENEGETMISQRFSGQEVILDTGIPSKEMSSGVDIYLNLKESCLELDFGPAAIKPGHKAEDLFFSLKNNYLDLVRFTENNPTLFQADFAADFAARIETVCQEPFFYREHRDIVAFKLYTLLQLLKQA